MTDAARLMSRAAQWPGSSISPYQSAFTVLNVTVETLRGTRASQLLRLPSKGPATIAIDWRALISERFSMFWKLLVLWCEQEEGRIKGRDRRGSSGSTLSPDKLSHLDPGHAMESRDQIEAR